VAVESLLQEPDEDFHQWIDLASDAERRQALAELWENIRNNGLYGGQPRSESSNRGVKLARMALTIAAHMGDDSLLAEAWRMMAYTLNADEQYAESIEYYRLAIDAFDRSGDYARSARNRLGFLTALSMVGRYDEALEAGLEAEKWFVANGDDEGYARLCVNLGNVYQRLDQHLRSIQYQQTAIEYFSRTGNEQALAQTYLNLGNSLSWLQQFERSDHAYRTSEAIGERLGLTDLVTQARYNRASLYFLRGRNMEALERFSELRELFTKANSARHAALCDLDETEIYLQLNLPNDAARLARSAMESFRRLAMPYEYAKATSSLGIALAQNRQFGDALQVFRSAQYAFEKENNAYWVALCALYRAEVLYAIGRLWEARSLAASAHEKFAGLGVESKRIVAIILMGKIALDLNQRDQAITYARSVLEWAARETNPLLLFPCYAFGACVADRREDAEEAQKLYERAADEIESRRTQFAHDDLRIPFFPDRQAVYESLVGLTLRGGDGPDVLAKGYAWCERAKSVGMVNLLTHHWTSIRTHGNEELLSRVNRIRDELNSSYLRLRSNDVRTPSVSSVSSIQVQESELLRSLRELSKADPQYASLQKVSIATLEHLRAAMPDDATLLEFFNVGNEVLAFAVSTGQARVFRHLAPLARIRYLENQLRQHFQKAGVISRKGDTPHSGKFANSLLAQLYSHLLEPLLEAIQTPDLIIVPHGITHYIPFAALFDGENYVLDSFNISYLPRASLLTGSRNPPPPAQRARPVIAGRPASSGDEEYSAIGDAVRDAEWRTGANFTRDQLLEAGLCCEFVHISTDVMHRQDNPMFSSIRCADSWVSLVDLYSMRCETSLLTLNGMLSGLNPAAGADSLAALMEALLYAGARSVLLNLWNVDRKTCGEFMGWFYRSWRSGQTKAAAVRQAAMAVRQHRPHPVYWAPYILVGQP
jgi:CHAT domain-containing protein